MALKQDPSQHEIFELKNMFGIIIVFENLVLLFNTVRGNKNRHTFDLL